MLDRHGQVILEVAVPNQGRAHWVELDQLAEPVVPALLAAEDHRFHEHTGVDLRALARAAWVDVQAGAPEQGGSTLSMQTARLLRGRPPGLRGKVVEAWAALRLDLHWDKEQILTWYLNRAYFGHRAWGIQAAARSYFDEAPDSLSLAEAATLVALLPAPSRLDPWEHPDEALAARDRVLDRLLETGLGEPEEIERARAEPMELRTPRRPQLAPHLAHALLEAHPEATTLHTTLDPDLQREAEALVRAHLDALDGREVDHAAALILDVPTGEVLAWVGSGDWAAEDGQVDGVTAPRSPGSALKPFAYGIAFEQGLSPADVLADVPRRFTTSHGTWAPTNYGGHHRGPVRAREALACSLNLPAIEVLERIGTATLLHRLRRAGISTLTERPAYYGLGLVLGDGEVSLLELTTAYAALARGGAYRPARPLLDQEGVPTAEALDSLRIMDARAAWLVADVLSDPVARSPSFGRAGPLERSFPAAAKTGTSTGFRDNWTVGFTPRHAVGVWVGNFDNRPMGQVSGISGAGPLWADLVDEVTGDERVEFERPEGLVRRRACSLSGHRPGEHCNQVVEDWYLRGQARRPDCDWHQACRTHGDPEIGVRWPALYASWAEEEGLLERACSSTETPPDLTDLGIAFPTPGSTFYVDSRLPAERQRVPLRAAAPSGARTARWSVDGVLLAQTPSPFTTLWQPTSAGTHRIELEVDGVRAAPVEVWIGGLDGPDPER